MPTPFSAKNSIVMFLLECGADPNLPNKDGPPLHIACTVGDIDIRIALLDYDAKIGQPFNGRIVLHFAVVNHRLHILTILLDPGADGNEKDAQGMRVCISRRG
jgi:ankyrin repeat protein